MINKISASIRLQNAQRRAAAEDGVALMSVMLFMIILTGMSLVLLSVIISQMGPALVAQKSTKTVYAAQAGLQAALGVVRSAAAAPVGGAVFGDPRALPCSFAGTLGDPTTALGYTVSIRYYKLDPTGKSAAWLASNALACSPPPVGVASDPKFAYMVSAGTGSSAASRSASEGNRSVAAVYKFKITNVNVPGGRVYFSSRTQCMQADSIAVGSEIKFVAIGSCTVANDDRQLWLNDTTYQIKLASTTQAGSPQQLCITGSGDANAKLAKCLTTSDRWNQLWSWNDNGRWEGQKNPISAGKSGVCLRKSGDYLKTGACDGPLDPAPAVGAGAAGFATHQIVNYKEFGRCADVTNKAIDSDYMIVYPCKQDPSGSAAGVTWNHQWTYSDPDEIEPPSARPEFVEGQVKVNPGTIRCLQTPSTTETSRDVNFKAACSGANTQKWKRYADSGDPKKSYTFQDTYGRCLTADPTNPHSTDVGPMSVIRVATCDGSEAQKWNAPASFTDAQFEGFKELG